jgi:hypothetical protein
MRSHQCCEREALSILGRRGAIVRNARRKSDATGILTHRLPSQRSITTKLWWDHLCQHSAKTRLLPSAETTHQTERTLQTGQIELIRD